MQKQINSLLEKEMDRKEFLQLMGLGIASISGLGGLSSLFTSSKGSGSKKAVGSYGSSAYGGASASQQALPKSI